MAEDKARDRRESSDSAKEHLPVGGQAPSLCKNEIVQLRGLLESKPYEFIPFLHPRMFRQDLKSNRSAVVGVADNAAQILPVNEAIAGDDMVNVLTDPI